MSKTIDITKDEALALIAILGHVGGEGRLREAVQSIDYKLQILLNLDGAVYSSAASLLNSKVDGSVWVEPIKTTPLSWGRLTVNE